jgi:hypothetical protein
MQLIPYLDLWAACSYLHVLYTDGSAPSGLIGLSAHSAQPVRFQPLKLLLLLLQFLILRLQSFYKNKTNSNAITCNETIKRKNRIGDKIVNYG